jgi:hypothetical protein
LTKGVSRSGRGSKIKLKEILKNLIFLLPFSAFFTSKWQYDQQTYIFKTTNMNFQLPASLQRSSSLSEQWPPVEQCFQQSSNLQRTTSLQWSSGLQRSRGLQ